MTAETSDGKAYLTVFTSRGELERWAGADHYALVQKASRVWERATQAPEPIGVVINPGNSAWTLEPQQIQALIEQIQLSQWKTVPRPG